MKIAFFMVPLLNYGGGAEKYFITVANAMAERGHDVSIVNLDRSFYRKLTFVLSIYYQTKLKNIRYTDKEIKKQLKGVRWIKSNLGNLKATLQKFDTIYSKNEVLDLLTLKLIGFKNLPPVIVGFRTPVFYPITSSAKSKFHNFLYLSQVYKWLLKDCVFLHVSNSDDELLIKKRFSNFRHKTLKIFHPFEYKAFRPPKKERKNDELRVLFAGRLNEQKGVDILVEVIERLSTKPIFKCLRFIIAGSGEWQGKVELLEKKFDNVNWLGHVPQDEMPEIYSLNDIVIAPSRWETMHWVSLEAQSCGLPVIVSDIPGPRDIIVNGKTGFLVKCNVESFVNKIMYFLNLKKHNPEKFDKFGIKAKKHIQEKFEPSRIYNQLESMFKKASDANKQNGLFRS